MKITRFMGNADKVLRIFLREFRKEIKALHGKLEIYSYRDDMASGYAIVSFVELDMALIQREATVSEDFSGAIMVYPRDLHAAEYQDLKSAMDLGEGFGCGQERKAAHFLARILRISKLTR